jgi:hypothetical protein
MEHIYRNQQNFSVKFTEFLMKKEEAPYEMAVVI